VAPEKQNWLKRIWRLTALLLLSWFVITYNPPSWDPYATYVFWSLVAAFIYWLTWEGIYQFRLARLQPAGVSADLPAPEPPPVPPPIPTPPKAVIPSGPSPYLEKLDELIQKEEIHRRPDLSREWVAEQLDISPGYLSQLINRSTGQNFSSYINAHRVETVKRLLHDPDYAQFSVMAIGQEAGFSSKSAYYTAFKKATGMTPSAFQKQTE
ncbi:MAG: AraC family transcriptional regulator, partial [Bacteroidota bacterium]